VYDEANPSGVEVVANGAATGCDSIIRVDLSFGAAVEEAIELSLCEGEQIEVNGTIYDIDNPSGTEVIEGGAASGCDSIIVVDLDFNERPAGSLEGPSSVCAGDSVLLTFRLSGGEAYDLSLSDENGVVDSFTGVQDGFTYAVSPEASTDYFISSLSAVINLCPAELGPGLRVEVSEVEAAAVATSDFGGFALSCAESEDGAVQGSAQNGVPPYDYAWSTGVAADVLQGLSAGTYTLTVTDAAGCTAVDSVALAGPPPLSISASGQPPACAGNASGQIVLEEPVGGTPPYAYSLDGAFFTGVTDFPALIPGLEPGAYDITVQDINDCRAEQEVTVEEAVPLPLDLGPNQTIELGDSIQLMPQGEIAVDTFFWRPDGLTDFEPFVSPAATTTYRLTAADSSGCSASDRITIIVERRREVYAPNVFSPNGDGTNDGFTLFVGDDVAAVTNFRIFDRWGNMVFEQPELLPNIEAEGWDGTFRGNEMDSGVFVFYAEVEFIDGQTEVVKGEVVLMR